MARSLRRTLHAHHEGQIVKAISASQNLAVAEQTWLVIREQGAIIEEAVDDGQNEDEPADEKGMPMSFDEKVALRAEELAQDSSPEVVDIHHAHLDARESASPDSSHSDVNIDVGT